MTPLFKKIFNHNNIQCEVIQDLAMRAESKISQEYIVIIDEKEVGFLSFEYWPNRELGFIYEIFVSPSHRNNGIGKLIIEFSEHLAKENNCKKIQLNVHPLDRTKDVDYLLNWYKKHGYASFDNNPLALEKPLRQ